MCNSSLSLNLSSRSLWLITSLYLLKIASSGNRGPLVLLFGLGSATLTPTSMVGNLSLGSEWHHPHRPTHLHACLLPPPPPYNLTLAIVNLTLRSVLPRLCHITHLRTHPPTPSVPTLQPYLSNIQPIPGIPGMAHPGHTIPFLPVGPVPVYDVRRRNDITPVTPEDVRPSLPPRKLELSLFHNVGIDGIHIGFTVSVPLKQHRSRDTQSRAEIAFE